ncbi:hypothetical protein [Palleronia rufa]|uniref:hypothetical protein n=1 Tax=Palleronia rufa TaxID=1530186 RepID=UPI000564A326|nr:hypothetical protein [Palleronia rufa]
MTARTVFSVAATLAALLGLAASISAYLSPATGVDDTAGPLLTALGNAGMAGLALVLLFVAWGRAALVTLYLTTALATCLAALLLQQPLILFPALVALIILPLGHLIGDG